MTARAQLAVWLGALAAFGLFLHVFSPILLPFVGGFAVAYFLDPVVERLVKLGAGRATATLAVLALFFLVFAAVLFVIVPLVERQLVDLAARAPEILRGLETRVTSIVARVSAALSPADLERLKGAAGGFAGDALKFLGRVVGGIWSGGLALVNLLSLIFIAPVVAFYLLRDWPRIVDTVNGWLPPRHAPTVHRLVAEADDMIAGFVRGVGIVCLTLAVFYGAALSLIGLQFGLVIGIGAGLISFIPFVGALGGFVAAVGMAVVQFDDPVRIGLTAAVFVAGQVLEGNFLTPKLVGERIRLHPVWVIFALLAGGLLFGFVGILLAVPGAAVIGVLVRFAVASYLQSPLYREGAGAPGDDDRPGAGGPPPP